MEVLIKRQSTPYISKIVLKPLIINELLTPQLFSGKKIIKIKCFNVNVTPYMFNV